MTAGELSAYVGLGSNLADPPRQIRRALDAFETLPGTRLVRHSALYGNPPMGPADQPDYVNAVAQLATTLGALELLAALQAVERALGRVRGGERWGPRTIDLDLLLYADLTLELDGLRVPHPGLTERAFVLVPLAEIAPQLEVPGHGPLAGLLATVDATTLVALSEEAG